LIADTAGDLFGTTGGPNFSYTGTVFELQPPTPPGTTWNATTLHLFGTGNDGYPPSGGLIFGNGGALLGMTAQGGGVCGHPPPSCGIIYAITP
jgi:hypothetical protein